MLFDFILLTFKLNTATEKTKIALGPKCALLNYTVVQLNTYLLDYYFHILSLETQVA